MIVKILIFLSVINFNDGSLESIIKDYLSVKLEQFAKWEYQIVSKPQKILKENYQIKIAEEKEFKLSNGYGYIPVIVVSKNNSSSFSFITVKLNLFDNVLVANRKIESGEDLASKDFSLELKDVSSSLQIPYDAFNNLNYYRTKTRISKGTILQSRMIEKIPLVNKGDKILVSLANGSIEVTMNAVARNNGCIGDEIKVEVNNRIYKAKIQELNKALIVN